MAGRPKHVTEEVLREIYIAVKVLRYRTQNLEGQLISDREACRRLATFGVIGFVGGDIQTLADDDKKRPNKRATYIRYRDDSEPIRVFADFRWNSPESIRDKLKQAYARCSNPESRKFWDDLVHERLGFSVERKPVPRIGVRMVPFNSTDS